MNRFAIPLSVFLLILGVKSCSSDFDCGPDACCYSGICRSCDYQNSLTKLMVAYILFAIGGIFFIADIGMCCCLCTRDDQASVVAALGDHSSSTHTQNALH